MKRSDAFPSNYLNKDDVANGPVVAVIDDVVQEMIRNDSGGEDKRAVMHFVPNGHSLKPLILNGVNWQVCEDAWGEESDLWRGKMVQVYHDPTVMFGRKKVGGVRLRAVVKPGTTNAAPSHIQPADVLTLQQAIAAAIDAGSTQQQLCQFLREQGLSKYNPVRDSALVRSFIARVIAESEQPLEDVNQVEEALDAAEPAPAQEPEQPLP